MERLTWGKGRKKVVADKRRHQAGNELGRRDAIEEKSWNSSRSAGCLGNTLGGGSRNAAHLLCVLWVPVPLEEQQSWMWFWGGKIMDVKWVI